MDPAVETLARSPKLPRLVDELQRLLRDEAERRERFYRELRDDEKAEFINGEVIVQSPVTMDHDGASASIYKVFSVYVDVHDLGYVGHEKILISLTRNDYEPDVCYFGLAKAAGLHPNQLKLPVPDFIAEVLSDSTASKDRGQKFQDYQAHGVQDRGVLRK